MNFRFYCHFLFRFVLFFLFFICRLDSYLTYKTIFCWFMTVINSLHTEFVDLALMLCIRYIIKAFYQIKIICSPSGALLMTRDLMWLMYCCHSIIRCEICLNCMIRQMLGARYVVYDGSTQRRFCTEGVQVLYVVIKSSISSINLAHSVGGNLTQILWHLKISAITSHMVRKSYSEMNLDISKIQFSSDISYIRYLVTYVWCE